MTDDDRERLAALLREASPVEGAVWGVAFDRVLTEDETRLIREYVRARFGLG